MRLTLVTLIVDDYDAAIDFFTGGLGFDLVEDSPASSESGKPKRWVVVRPPGAESGLLLARAAGDAQAQRVGDQTAGRVGFFLQVDDVDAALDRLRAHWATRSAAGGPDVVVRPPHDEPYGRVAVVRDIAGNLWDVIGPV